MKQVVIMPGGFHPFHAGHYALYQQAQQAFPNADVYVAATNDTSARPFPFAVKEKLAQLAGVAPGHFVQVKSPFQAREITANLDPDNTQLIFVRSEKDADKPPQAGGVKKDGNPAYLQPYKDAADLQPMNQHAYMAYLPTVEFGPGMTSATEIRTAWPQLNEKRKTALVMSLYPRTQKNPKLAATVVKMLDVAIVGSSAQNGENVNATEGSEPFVWKRPAHIGGSHTEQELIKLGFKKSRYNTWGGTQSMWNRLAGVAEDQLDELRILHPAGNPGRIDVYYRPLGTPIERRKLVAKNIPYNTLDLLTKALVKKFAIKAEDLEIVPVAEPSGNNVAEDYVEEKISR